MNAIPRYVHGIGDYLTIIVLMTSPWLFGFTGNDKAMGVAVGCGAGLFLLSLLTDDEVGLFPVVPFRVRVFLEVVTGVFLAASPWLLGFASVVAWPHFVLGVLLSGGVILTKGSSMLRLHSWHGL